MLKVAQKGDLKEFFHIGNPAILNPENIWPVEISKNFKYRNQRFNFKKNRTYSIRGNCNIS